ncbi:MAG: TonB-dependent receptor, partial [Bacteroidota bacterium]
VHQVVGDDGWIDAALFHADYRQLIEAGVDPDQFVIRFENVARARIQGVEISTGMSWWDGMITTHMGFTVMEPRDVTKNGPLKFRPKFIGVSSAECAFEMVRAGIDYRYISRQEAVDEDLIAIANIIDGSERVPIHVVDLRCSVTLDAWGLPVRPGLVVKNALNYQYVELVGNLAPPRTIIFSLDALF